MLALDEIEINKDTLANAAQVLREAVELRNRDVRMAKKIVEDADAAFDKTVEAVLEHGIAYKDGEYEHATKLTHKFIDKIYIPVNL